MATEEKVIKITIDDKEALVRIDNISKQLDALGKNETATKKALIAEQKLLIKNLVEEEKLQQQRIKTLIESERLEQKKIQTTNAANKQTKVTQGYLNELKESVKQLEQAYFQLSEAEFKNAKNNVSGTKGQQVIASLKEQRAELANAEAAFGKHNLNVGNYSSATKMLGINIGQVMKEMPNFAISARIGIMSLTNNLPMLAETIKQVRVEQLAMIAAGQKAPSMFSLISKSVFGLTGVMSIAMVLMQIYGADIIAWVGKLFKGEEAVKKLTNAEMGLNTVTQTLNKTMKDGGGVYAQAVGDIEKMTISLKNSKGSKELAKKALDDYNESLGVTFGKAKDVDEALKLIESNEADYIAAMQNMAFANAFFSQSAEDAVKIMQVNTKSQQDILRNAGVDAKTLYESWQTVDKAIQDAEKRSEETGDFTVRFEKTKNKLLAAFIPEMELTMGSAVTLRRSFEKKITDIENAERARQIKEIQKNQEISLKEAEKYYQQYAALYKKNGWDFKENEIKKTKDAKENGLDLDMIADELYRKYFEKRAKEIEEYLKLQQKVKETTLKLLEETFKEEAKMTDDNVKDVNDYLKILNDAKIEANRDDFAYEQSKLDTEYQMRIAAAKKVNADTYAIEQAYKVKTAMLTAEKFNAQLQLISSFIGNTTKLFKEGTKAQKAMTTAQISVDGVIAGFQAFNVAAYKSGIPVPYNYIAGGLAAAGVAAATASAIKDVWAVDENGTSGETSTTQVKEKFHTGTYRPSSANEEKEITRTLLTTERVLSPTQTTIFDSMIGRMQSYGGSSNITSGVGTNDYLQENMLIRAFSVALKNQKPQQISMTEFSNQAQRMQQLENNLYLR